MGRIPRGGIINHAARLASDQADPEETTVGPEHI